MKMLNGLSVDAKDILIEEYNNFKNNTYSCDESCYYVYILFNFITGKPFYIGKGKNNRAYQHLYKKGDNKLKDSVVDYLYSVDEPPIVFVVKSRISEKQALKIEKDLIEHYGRLINGSGILTNVFSGDVRDIDEEKRRAGGLSHNINGTRRGICTKEWRENNKELTKEYATKAGKESWRLTEKFRKEEHREWSSKGGHKTGSMVFWTNGKETTRSNVCPGEGWYRGNCNVNNKSIQNLKLPSWTNGIKNRKSHEKPDDGYFNGVTRKYKNGKIVVIVYKDQIDESNIPSGYSYGHNIVNEV